MKVRELLENLENEKSGVKTPINKQTLSDVMKNFHSVIERYEESGKIHKDDITQMETLKDMIKHMIKMDDRRNEG